MHTNLLEQKCSRKANISLHKSVETFPMWFLRKFYFFQIRHGLMGIRESEKKYFDKSEWAKRK